MIWLVTHSNSALLVFATQQFSSAEKAAVSTEWPETAKLKLMFHALAQLHPVRPPVSESLLVTSKIQQLATSSSNALMKFKLDLSPVLEPISSIQLLHDATQPMFVIHHVLLEELNLSQKMFQLFNGHLRKKSWEGCTYKFVNGVIMTWLLTRLMA